MFVRKPPLHHSSSFQESDIFFLTAAGGFFACQVNLFCVWFSIQVTLGVGSRKQVVRRVGWNSEELICAWLETILMPWPPCEGLRRLQGVGVLEEARVCIFKWIPL